MGIEAAVDYSSICVITSITQRLMVVSRFWMIL